MMKNIPPLIFLFIVLVLAAGLRTETANASGAGSASTITQSQCSSFDHSQNKMGPTRDQRKNGLCWAFVDAALGEEIACERRPELCGKSLSPLDASRCHWKVGQKNMGGLVSWGLKCLLDHGICAEEAAPYNKNVEMDLTCTHPVPMDPEVEAGQRCVDPKTQSDYRHFLSDWEQHQMDCNYGNEVRDPVRQLVSYGRNLTDEEGVEEEELEQRLPPASQFLKKLLIPPRCERERVKIDPQDSLNPVSVPFPGGVEDIKKISAAQKYTKIAQVFDGLHRSVGLSVCLDKISAELAALYTPGESGCAGHGVAANASRWHNGRCQIHIKNSWGKIPEGSPVNGQIEGWVDAETLLDATFQFDYIGPKKSAEGW